MKKFFLFSVLCLLMAFGGGTVWAQGNSTVSGQVAMCSPVVNLALGDVVGTDATITWQPSALGAPLVYNITLKDLDAGTESSYSTTGTFYTFSGLEYTTHYRAYVEVLCADNTTSPTDSVDFTTMTASAPFPYFEDFEGNSAAILALYSFTNSGTDQWVYGSAASDSAGGHCLYVSADSGATNIYDGNSISHAYAYFNVTFPSDDIEYHLSFDYRAEGEINPNSHNAYDSMLVFMVDIDEVIPANGIPYNAVPLMWASNVTSWSHFDVILQNVAGTAKQIVFYWYSNGISWYGNHLAAAVDNVSLRGSECAQPNGLYASNIDMYSATLNWCEAGNATVWLVYYKASGDTAYTQPTVSSDTFVTITGLQANTNYEFYVVADCGSSESEPSTVAMFRTDCSAVEQLPYIEDFESGIYASASQQNYISCWNRSSLVPDYYVYVSDAYWRAHNGFHFLDFNHTPNCYDIAIMPELDAAIDASGLMVTFYACHSYSGYLGALGTLEVGVMTDPEVDSTFVSVATIDLSALNQYEYAEQMVSFVNYTGDGKYIAFRVSNSDQCSYYIDDLMLEERPACMYPNAFSAVSIGTDSVTLTWDELGEATTWNIQYGTPGFTPSNDMASLIAYTVPFSLGDLDNLTAYDFYVQSDCLGARSDWVGPLTVVTGVTNMGIFGVDTLTACEAIICDNGGYDSVYASDCDYILVIYPAMAGNGLEITGTADLSEGMYGYYESHLYFHDGVGTEAPLIANITGVNPDISVASSGPVTIHFTSSYYTSAGFLLHVSCATCTPPTGLAASNITNNEVTLSWHGDVNQYAVSMTGDATGYFTTSDSSIVITGLTSNSDYTFQVRSLCGTDSSLLSPSLAVSTTCDAITITAATPWSENFESYVGNGEQPFVCWARPVEDDFFHSPFVSCGWAPSCHSGANSAEFRGSDGLLVLPVFSNDVHELRLSFWATAMDTTSGTLEVGVMSNFNDPTTFELVGTCDAPGPRGADTTANGNHMGPFDFANVQATNGRIALRYSNYDISNSWNLDDFTVEIAPLNCVMPTGLTVTNFTQNSATVAWTAGGNETAWKLQYRQAGNSNWGNEISVTTNSYDITGLMAETVYQVRVKSDCDNGEESAWVMPYDFTLPVIQPTVVTFAATGITQTTGTINGAITDPGNQPIIQTGFEWMFPTDDTYSQQVSSSLAYMFTGLYPNTCVIYRVYAMTAYGTVYGDTMSFCTLPGDSPECDVPTGLDTTSVANETIGITWDSADVYSWYVRYRAQNGQWTPMASATNSYTIAGLTGLTTYEIQVLAVCADGQTSDWSASLLVTTKNVGIESWLANSVTLYPNPAKEYVDIRVDGDLNVTMMEVYDVYGKVVRTVVGANDYSPLPTRINVSGLAAGMYFVRVATDRGVVTKSFVKK